MSDTATDRLDHAPARGRHFSRTRVERALLMDLIAVLEAAPKGLRRWSVMRALRDRRSRAGYDITLKFEDEVERLFRQFCVVGGTGDDAKPFFRPKETAGEVWAVDPTRLALFLASPGTLD